MARLTLIPVLGRGGRRGFAHERPPLNTGARVQQEKKCWRGFSLPRKSGRKVNAISVVIV
jgi:hypothetical protein